MCIILHFKDWRFLWLLQISFNQKLSTTLGFWFSLFSHCSVCSSVGQSNKPEGDKTFRKLGVCRITFNVTETTSIFQVIFGLIGDLKKFTLEMELLWKSLVSCKYYLNFHWFSRAFHYCCHFNSFPENGIMRNFCSNNSCNHASSMYPHSHSQTVTWFVRDFKGYKLENISWLGSFDTSIFK